MPPRNFAALLLLLLVTVSGARPVHAEQIRLSLDEALARAGTSTPELSESRRDLALAKSNLARSRVWLPSDPSFSVGAYHSTLKEDIFNDQGELVDRRSYGPNYTFSLSQELELAGQRGLRVDAATQDVERARLALQFQRQTLAASVRAAFIHALIEKEKLALVQRSFQATNELADSPRDDRGRDSGDRTEANLMRIQKAHATRQLALAKQSHQQALAELKRLCRIPAAQDTELVGSPLMQVLALASVSELTSRALANRPDLAASRRAVESANASLAARHREKIPNVTVSASVSEFAGGTLAGGDISVPIPVFTGRVGDVEDAIAERNHAARQLDLTISHIEREVAVAYDACMAGAVDVQAYQSEIVPLNDENLKIQQRLFARGDSGLSQLIGTQADYFSAQLESLSAIEQYNVQLIELERVVAADIGPQPVEADPPTP